MWSEKVKDLMKEKKINQKELACKSGITESSMSRYLACRTTPRLDVIINVARALGEPVSSFTNDTLGKKEQLNQIKSFIIAARKGSELTKEETDELIRVILGDLNGL